MARPVIAVAGGFYIEKCLWPNKTESFGSGGRAALALRTSGVPVDFHTFAPQSRNSVLEGAFFGTQVILRRHESKNLYEFVYLHPLARPTIAPWPIEDPTEVSVSSDIVLRYGAIEGDFKVTAERAVYDPQSPYSPKHFRENGSSAKELAIVLNRQELQSLTQESDEATAAKALASTDSAQVVIVKNGAHGSTVYLNGVFASRVRPLETQRITKIGTGDIYSAAFAYWWAHKNDSATEAASKASVCVAAYCESRCMDFEEAITYSFQNAPLPDAHAEIYLAGPFFTAGQYFLIEELYRSIRLLGGKVFSPIHHVGLGLPHDVVPKDLEALERCRAVLAVLDGNDPGTIFEVGYAVKHDLPVILLSESPRKNELTMFEGTNCDICSDLCSAVYRAIWSSWR